MTPEDKQKVIEALQIAIDHLPGDVFPIEEALAIMDQQHVIPTAWIVHATNPWVTMDPPIEGGLPRTPLYR